MKDKRFDPKHFKPTKFSTAEDKAKFAVTFVKFVEGGFQERMFGEAFYRRLSNTFGHIAHYSREGFYGNFFASLRGQVEFLEQCQEWPCHGQEEWTFCDVERAIQDWMRETDVLGAARKRLATNLEQAERAQLRALAKKYPDEVR